MDFSNAFLTKMSNKRSGDPPFHLSPKAADDLRSINRYTGKIWGNKQRRLYVAKLKWRIEWLAENPRLGRPRPDIREGLVCFPEGEHVIFYRISGDFIEVLAILHSRMLPDDKLR